MITDRPATGEADFEQERPRLVGLAYRIGPVVDRSDDDED